MPTPLIFRGFHHLFPHSRKKPEEFFLKGFLAWLAFPVNFDLLAAEFPVAVSINFPIAECFVDDHGSERF
ncbi:MAG: hypothetical protein V4640_07645 [Verrucomicrobiota bacterium]